MARLAYLGTPRMAVPPLRALAGAGHDIVIAITRPDKRRGRGGRTTPSPVKEAANALGIPVSHDLKELATSSAELAVVVAYGRIIPAELLEQLPMVNLHFSLLPRWRGAAPVERAILAGDRETGVCLMKVEEGLDTGPVYAVRTVPIDDEVTLEQLREQLVDVASVLAVELLADGVRGLPEPQPQHGEPTMAEKVTKEDLHLDWRQPALQLKRVIRLGHAWTTFRGKRLMVLDATVDEEADTEGGRRGDAAAGAGRLQGPVVTTGRGRLVLQRVQPESRSPMSADDWVRGVRPGEGERLGTD
jgi:methionyl-tRNA formyltransferase